MTRTSRKPRSRTLPDPSGHLWFFFPGRFLSCFGPVQSFLGVTALPE
jgi:hypothetical protein